MAIRSTTKALTMPRFNWLDLDEKLHFFPVIRIANKSAIPNFWGKIARLFICCWKRDPRATSITPITGCRRQPPFKQKEPSAKKLTTLTSAVLISHRDNTKILKSEEAIFILLFKFCPPELSSNQTEELGFIISIWKWIQLETYTCQFNSKR